MTDAIAAPAPKSARLSTKPKGVKFLKVHPLLREDTLEVVKWEAERLQRAEGWIIMEVMRQWAEGRRKQMEKDRKQAEQMLETGPAEGGEE